MTVLLQPFWPEKLTLWFAQFEALLELAGISSQRSKFNQVVAQLNQQHAVEVEDNHHSTSCTRPLRPAKGRARHSPVHFTRTKCTAAPLSQGNGRQEAFTVPSAPQGPGTRCTGRLPTHHLDQSATTPMQAFLAGQTECSLDSTSRLVDRICEITPLPPRRLSRHKHPTKPRACGNESASSNA